MKKLVTILIFILLISSLFTVKAFAAEYSDILSEERSEVLEILSVYNLLNGYSDGTFRPGNCVTRAEMSKIAAILAGYDEFTKGMTSTFSDMQGHWAERYVEIINELDILKGYENNTYEPDKYVTYTESVVAILKILGYKDSALSGTYPENYMKLAKELGLFKNVNNPSVYMTRESLATLIYNALFVNIVEIKNDKAVLTNKVLINNIGKKESVKIDNNYALKHSYIDLSNYFFNVCDVYYDIYGKIVLVKNPVYKSIDGYVKSAVSTNVIFLSDSIGNTKLYNLNNVPIIFNGIKSKVANEDLKDSNIRLIIDDKNPDSILGAVVTKITDKAIVDAKSLYKEEDTSFIGKTLPKDDDKVLLDKVKITGAVSSIYDIEEDDIVYFYETKERKNNKSILMINVVRNSVSGLYRDRGRILYEEFFTIDISNYKLHSEFKLTESLSSGDKIKAILDEDNKIVKVNILKYNKEPQTYAMILNVENKAAGELPVVSLINQYGKTLTYKLRENSGEVTKKLINGTLIYETSLSKNSFVKYDAYDNSSIKIIKKTDTVNVKSNYNSKTGALSGLNGYIGANTSIIQLNNRKYDIVNKSSLGNYIEGKAVFNSNGAAEMFILEKNLIKTSETPITEIPITTPSVNKYSGNIYGAVQVISGNKGSEKIKLFNLNDAYNVDKNLNKTLNNFKNQLVRLTINNDIVTDIIGFSPEISKSKITAVYNGQLQIDGISYVEYSSSVLVYTCTYDSSGNITSFKASSISDIKINSSAQFYNTNNNYNGVMDIIIIYN